MLAGRHEDDGSAIHAGLIAPALIARLRIDGRDAVADALTALLGNAYIDCDPRFLLDEDDGWIAERDALIARLRAEGHDDPGKGLQTSELINLKHALNSRLCLDGHAELADAVKEAWWTFDRRAHGEREPRKRHPAPADKRTFTPEDAEPPEPGEVLGRAHPADVLACAALMRLRAEGHEVMAGTIMAQWLNEIVGPIADPADIATALVPRLRAEDRGEIADTIEPLLRDADIDRDPEEILAIWLNEVAGPLIDAGPLAAAMIARLRWDRRQRSCDYPTCHGIHWAKREGLQEAIVTLLRDAVVGRFDAGALVSFRTAPTPALGFSTHGGARWWFLSLTGGVRLEFSLPGGTARVRITTSRVLAELVPCLHLDVAFGAAFGCGVLQAGGLTAESTAPYLDRTFNATSVSAGGRVGLELPHPRFFPRGIDPFASVDMIGAVQRTSIFVNNYPRFEWSAPPITAAIGLGVVLSR